MAYNRVNNRRTRYRCAVAAALLSVGSLAGCATSGMSTVYYNVPGTTVEQITEQISSRGPQNGHAIGTAETRMTPKIITINKNGQCQIASAEVQLGMRITLPRWTELHKADARTKTAFEELGKHVRWHEQQHVDISNRYVVLIEERLMRIPPQKNCRKALDKAREVFKQGFKEHNEAQLAFDESERDAIRSRLEALHDNRRELPPFPEVL